MDPGEKDALRRRTEYYLSLFSGIVDGGLGGAPLADGAPVDVSTTAASAGVSAEASRADHKHDVSTAAASTLTATTTNTEGTADSLARSDHTHDITTAAATTLTATTANAEGTATTLARSDHTHDITTAAPAQGIGGSNAEGSATTFARSDHDHTVRETAGPTNLTVGSITDGQYVRRSGTALVGIDPPGGGVTLASSAPADVTTTAADVGIATDAARADHKHDISTAAAIGLSAATTNTEGTATSVARSDHTHAIDATTGTLSTINAADAAVDGTAAGFARRDHQHPVATAAPSTGIGGSNAEGTSTSLARADHNHALRTTTGPADLTIGAIADGEYVVRSGATLIGTTPPSGGAALTDDPPEDVTTSAAVVGVSTEAARADHKHDISTAAASTLTADTANAEGSATSLARSDHTHDITTASPSTGIGGANSEGTASTLARSDHNHTLRETGGPQSLTIGAIAEGQYLARSGTAIIGATVLALTSALPEHVDMNPRSAGVSTTAARADHKHDTNTGTPVGLTADTTNTQGASQNLSPAEHTHAIDVTTGTLATVNAGDAAVNGTAAGLARRDHQHPVSTAAPATGIGGANSEGTATSLARSDHNHTLRTTTGPTDLTIGAVANGEYLIRSGSEIIGAATAGVLLTDDAPADVTTSAAAVGVSEEAARADHKHDISTAAPAVGSVVLDGANAEGTSTSVARADHVHNLAAAAPPSVGTANSEGVATSVARSDHVHNHGTQTTTTHHALTDAATGAGFQPRSNRAAVVDPTVNDDIVAGYGAGAYWLNHANGRSFFLHSHTAGAAVWREVGVPTTAAPVTIGLDAANAEGSSTSVARADHIHNLPAAAPAIGIGAANSEGTSSSVARADHMHALRTGSTDLTIGAIADGQTVSRSGTTLIGVAAGAALTSSAPADVTTSAAVIGVATTAARADHKHDIDTTGGTQSTINAGDAAAEGTGTGLARRDHQHAVSTASPGVALSTNSALAEGVDTALARADHVHSFNLTGGTIATVNAGDAASDGTGTGFARRDHQHPVSTGTPGAVSVVLGGSAAEGTSTELARADHVHPATLGVAVGLTANSANSAGTGGSFAGFDHTHDLDTATGTQSSINAGDAAAEGSAAGIARRDHQHAVATAAPSSVGIGNAEGTSTSLARADHVHNHGSQAVETHHSLVSSTLAGFQPRSNRTATTDPVAGDDSGDGYGVGSYWVNTSTGRVWMRVNDASVIESWQRVGHDITRTEAWSAAPSFNARNYDDLVLNTECTADTNITITSGIDGDRGKIYLSTTNITAITIRVLASGRTVLYSNTADIGADASGALRAYVWDYRFVTLESTACVLVTVYSLGGYRV